MSGWKRLAVVVAAVWLLLVGAMTAFDWDSIDAEVWNRRREASLVYKYSGKTPNGFFAYHQSATLQTTSEHRPLRFVPLDEARTPKHETQRQSNNSAISFDDLIPPTTVVEFRWLYFLAAAFGPLALFAIGGLAVRWVRDGFRGSALPDSNR
jgi:hypothetical protein